MIYGIVLGDYY